MPPKQSNRYKVDQKSDPRYIPIGGRDMSCTEQTENKRANNNNIAQYNHKVQFIRIIKYLRDPMLQDKYMKACGMHLDNKNKLIEFDLRDGTKIRITHRMSVFPLPDKPGRQLESYILYHNDAKIYYSMSQEEMITYISKEILHEERRTDKTNRRAHG